MKRFILACSLCTAMLATAVFVFMPSGLAKGLFSPAAPQKENVLEALLDLPAPPPPNPLETARARDDSFFDLKNPPPDDAPIDDLIDYWSRNAENGTRRSGYYVAKPSPRVVERLLAEEERDPGVIQSVLPVLSDDKRIVDIVKSMYDSSDTSRDEKKELRQWLTINSGLFADDLERVTARTHDSGGYVDYDHEENVLALTKYDWERAKSNVDRMYADSSNPVTKVLATWALYKHAMESNDISDTDRYRNELMHYVENRDLSAGVRDKANDALMLEQDFPGRDDWAFRLFEDETWVSLPQYTGLTTLISNSPPDKYASRLIELAGSKNKIVRTAAVRCLTTILESNHNEDVIRALLPWISDPNWVERDPSDQSRARVVSFLQSTKMPESVPALIAALDEKAKRQVEDFNGAGNFNTANVAVYGRTANAMNTAANAMNTAARQIEMQANSAASNANRSPKFKEEIYFPLRDGAVRALAFQADSRAAPALSRILNSITVGYQRTELIGAILACGGYSVSEQIDALEKYARKTGEIMSAVDSDVVITSNSMANAAYYNRGYYEGMNRIIEGDDQESALGLMVAMSREPNDELVRSTITRIEKLERKDPLTAQTLRRIITSWKGLAVSGILLNDLRTGKAESAAVIRLLTERKSIKEKLAAEIDDARKGTPIAAGIAACLTDDASSYATALDSRSNETRTAVLACARLIRSELPLAKVVENLNSTDAVLKTAAELYLESEDSPAAHSLIFAHHAGEAKILGATSFFKGRKDGYRGSVDLSSLFSSVSTTAYWAPSVDYGPGDPHDLEKSEERLQKEVKDDASLAGVYSYQDNFVRIYKDKVVYSWEDDPSRYHERLLSTEEFEQFKQYLAAHHVSEMKPFLSCSRGCGTTQELLMLGKNGGSRVYLRSDRTPEFFVGLEKIFSVFRNEPAAIKYTLSKDVPGLELLFASDQYDAETVWKQGTDLRIVVSNKEIRAKVDDEVSQLEEEEQSDEVDPDDAPDDESADIESAPEPVSPSEKMRIKRQYEGYAWHHIESGRLGDPVDQPAGAEYIPPRDQLDVQPDDEAWKARTAAFEIRADESGLYKVSGGKITKLRAGEYSRPVVSANGRWVIVNKSTEDQGESLVRFNLATNREYPVTFNGDGNLYPRCYVPAVGKFLLMVGYYDGDTYDRDESDDDVPAASGRQFYTMDPETGAVASLNGEARPLSGQTFRPLQPAAKPNQFWAAMPSKNSGNTVVGVFDSRLFRFTPVLKLPKINFDSMDMWVDETENKIYFVYSGHLLRVPLKNPQTK